MPELRPGRHRRLKERFSAFDADRNRLAVPFAAIVLIPSILVVVLLKYVALPDSVAATILFGTWFAAFFCGLGFAVVRCRRLARQHGLICSRCRQPLAGAGFSKRTGSRRYRPVFTVPERCPSCQLNIDDAARPPDDDSA